MKEFFGIGGFQRAAEGFMSWQHLVFVTVFMAAMFALSFILGKRNRNKTDAQKNVVLIWSAILIDGFELFKIILNCAVDPSAWRVMLPLFLCSIQLIAIPLAAFSKGRIKDAALDFVCIFGLLGAILGTCGAAQNYNAYPVLSFPNVVSAITHSISGFASLYIMLSGMASMKRENIWITFAILIFFCITAYIANVVLDYNYMFLMAGDGTPYDILFNLVNGHHVLYPVCVVALFLVYICLFYAGTFLVKKKKKQPVAV